MEDRGGRVAILMPHATLEPIYKLLLREFIGEANANEAAWRDHLEAGLDAASLDVKVVLAEREMALGEIGDLAPGQTIKFTASTKTIAEIRAGETCGGARSDWPLGRIYRGAPDKRRKPQCRNH